MAVMEELHKLESTGQRNALLEQEQSQQEHETDSEHDDLDFLSNSEILPQNIIEPAIELQERNENAGPTLQDIHGDDEISLSIQDTPLKDVDGPNEYPISAEYGTQADTDQLDYLMTDIF